MLTSTEVFSSILNIDELPNIISIRNSITYIAIGCARHNQWTDTDDQQFPIFIKNFKKYNDDLRINLILIDPDMDDDEHMTKNKSIKHIGYYTNDDLTICYKNIIKCENNIYIYYFNQYVSYIPDIIDSKYNDITNILQTLNDKCIRDDGVLIVHDFSGMDIYLLDKYFFKYTEIYSDKILYNITNNISESGCYVDLSDPVNHVIFEENNETITIDNSSKMHIKLINFILNDPKYDIVKRTKIQNRKKDLLNFFMIYFHTLRRIIIWRKTFVENKNVDICKRVIKASELKLIDHLHNTNLFDAYVNNDLEYLENSMKQLFENKKRDIEILYETELMIDYEEPNTWLNEIDYKIMKYVA
jgi:hypothetical protein